MTKAIDPYSRVYWRAIDDSKFRDIWADDAALAAWLRLLVAADMAWPASASLYHGVRKAALDKLVAVKLVDLVTGSRFRIHGLDRERAKRSARGTIAAAARWESDGESDGASQNSVMESELSAESDNGSDSIDNRTTPKRHTTNVSCLSHSVMALDPVSIPLASREHPPSSAKGMPSQEEPRRDETSQEETRREPPPDGGGNARDPNGDVQTNLALLAERLTQHPYVMVNTISGLGAKAVEMAAEHGEAEVARSWERITARVAPKHPTLRQLVLGADDELSPIPGRMTEAERKADEQKRIDQFMETGSL